MITQDHPTTKIEIECTNAGLPLAEARRVEEAVAAFDSDQLRQLAVEELIRAYHRSYKAARQAHQG